MAIPAIAATLGEPWEPADAPLAVVEPVYVGDAARVAFENLDDRLRFELDGELLIEVEIPAATQQRSTITLGTEGGGARFDEIEIFRDIYYTTGGAMNEWSIPDDCYVMLGDNTQDSADSREWRLVGYRFTDGERAGETIRGNMRGTENPRVVTGGCGLAAAGAPALEGVVGAVDGRGGHPAAAGLPPAEGVLGAGGGGGLHGAGHGTPDGPGEIVVAQLDQAGRMLRQAGELLGGEGSAIRGILPRTDDIDVGLGHDSICFLLAVARALPGNHGPHDQHRQRSMMVRGSDVTRPRARPRRSTRPCAIVGSSRASPRVREATAMR